MRVEVVAALIRRSDQILITQRPGGVHLAGLWEFPGGKVEPGESLEAALQREIFEELGVKIRVNDEFFTVEHDYPTKSVRVHFFNCTILEGRPTAIEVAEIRWVRLQALDNYPFPAADGELIIRLRAL